MKIKEVKILEFGSSRPSLTPKRQKQRKSLNITTESSQHNQGKKKQYRNLMKNKIQTGKNMF